MCGYYFANVSLEIFVQYGGRRISTRREPQNNSGCTGALYPWHSKTNIKPRPSASTVLVSGRSLPILPLSMAFSTSLSVSQFLFHRFSSFFSSPTCTVLTTSTSTHINSQALHSACSYLYFFLTSFN